RAGARRHQDARRVGALHDRGHGGHADAGRAPRLSRDALRRSGGVLEERRRAYMTTRRRRALMSWSSGKDCAYALHVARAAGELEVVGLLTTMNESADRVSMHGVRRELLRRQAASLGLPQLTVELPDPCTNEIYERRMGALVSRVRAEGVEVVIFGDLFLE